MRVPIGLHVETRKLIFIGDLDRDKDRGLKCQCACVECGSRLVARMGDSKADHFAHHKKADYTLKCTETAIHIMAKTIIMKRRAVYLPTHKEESVYQSDLDETIIVAKQVLGKKGTCIIDPVEEQFLRTASIKPDITAKFIVAHQEHDLAIEVAVTHFVDDEKKDKTVKADISMVEVDVSELLSAKEITQAAVRKVLDSEDKWKWIYKSPKWTDKIKQEAENEAEQQQSLRNKEIYAWVASVRDYFMKRKGMTLPSYVFQNSVTPPVSMIYDGKELELPNLPKMPEIGGWLELHQISEMNKGEIQFSFKYRQKIHSVPLRLSDKILPAWEDVDVKTHLILTPYQKERGLPRPEILEKTIYWGHNERAMRYISVVEQRVEDFNKSHEEMLETQEKQELKKQYGIFEQYLLGRQSPAAPDRQKINVRARQYWTEMNQKGIPVDKIFHSVKDGWIFGCDNDWQTMVMYVLCRDPSAHARARIIYTDLNRDFKFYCLWVIGYLRRNESMLLKMNYDISLLPDPIKVITDYLNILADKRVLMPPIGRDYEKRFICGDRFLRK